MHVLDVFAVLTLLAVFVMGSPLEVRGTSLTASAKPKFKVGTLSPHPIGTVNPGVSKREDYNELVRRSSTLGLFIACDAADCSGNCYSYDLPLPAPLTCYTTVTYASVNIAANSMLPYEVYAGPNCQSTLAELLF